MKWLKNNLVPIAMLILGLISFKYAAVSVSFLASEVFTRFVRNMLFVLALILPVTCGMGINFAIIVGALSAQAAIVVAVDLNLTGIPVILFSFVLSILLAVIFGALVAWLLNKAKGNEMIVSIMIGQISAVVFQFVFMVAYGLIIQPKNEDILLDSGVGVRSMLDAANLSQAFKSIMPFTMDGKVYSAFPLVIIALFTLFLIYLQRSRLGVLAKAVGSDMRNAGLIGINSDRIRSLCIIISTVFAAVSQVIAIADYGTVKVYTGHAGIDTYAAAAILVGGASIREAKLRNCFIGVLLFHTLFITSPMAGQNLFSNPSVGEYFRSFLAYGIIVIAIIMNLKNEKERKFEDFRA